MRKGARTGMLRPTFLMRRLGSAWLLVSCLMATVFVTSALVSALVSFYSGALPATVSSELAKSGTLSVAVSGGAGAPAAQQAGQVSSRIGGAFGSVPAQFYQATWSDELRLPGGSPHAAVPTLQAAALSGLTANAVLTSGSWPGPPRAGQPVSIALPATTAADLRLGVGSVLRLRNLSTRAVVRLRVTGLFRRRDPAALYWGLDLIGAAGNTNIGGFNTYGPAVVSPAAFGSGSPLPVSQVSYLALPKLASITPGELGGLASRVTAAVNALQAGGSLVVTTSMPQTLQNVSAGLEAAKSLVIISGLQLLLLSAAALALASRLLASHRDEESALLAARGAARWQLVRPSLSEAAVAVFAAAAFGVLGGGKLASVLLADLTGQQQHLPAGTAQAWLAGAALAVFSLGVVLWPALRPAGIAAVRIRRGRQAAVASAASAGVDIALVVLALLAVHELRSYSAAAHAASGGGVDPVIAAAPALALAGLAVIPLRLLPIAARALERVTARSRKFGSAMANWEISRRPLRQSGPALLVILAVGTSTLALAQYQSWRQSAADQASFAAGADVRVSLAQPVSLPGAGRIASLTGVTSAVPVSQVPLGGSSQMLVIGTPQAARTVLLRPDLAPVPPAALYKVIGTGSRAGLALPGRPRRLEITASLGDGRGPQLGPVTATAIIEDAFGLAYQVTTTAMPADGRLHQLVAQLAAGAARPAYPLRLIGLSLNYDMPQYPATHAARIAAASGQASLAGIAVSPAGSGASGSPAGPLQSLAGWNRNISDTGLQIAEGELNGAGKAAAPVITSVSASGSTEAIGFDTGYGPSIRPGEGPAGGFGPLPAGIELDIPAPPAPLPVLVSAGYASANALSGSTFAVTIAGIVVQCTAVTTLQDFPTGAAVVASQSAVEQILTSQGAGGSLPALSWWLSTAGGSVPAGLPPGSAVEDAAQNTLALQRNPLSAAPVQAALAVAAAAALLAALGFLVSVAASARDRRSQRALLAALGVPAPAQARLFCLEEIMISVPAAIVGLGVGVGLARLLIPSITLTATAGQPVPPVLVLIPVGWVALVALLAPAIPVVAALITSLRQPDPAAELRAAEAAG
jgi:hypothetical protein